MGEAGANLRQIVNQLRINLSDLLHVTAIAGVQHLALDRVALLVAVLDHRRALTQHFSGDREILFEDRRRPFFLSQFQGHPPACYSHFAGYLPGKRQGFWRPVLHAQQGQRGTQAQIAHAMTTLADDFMALFIQRQAIDFHHVVQHSGKYGHHFAIGDPIETRPVGEWVLHKWR